MTDTKHTPTERDALRTALSFIADADVPPGHCNYLTKARMAEIARNALASYPYEECLGCASPTQCDEHGQCIARAALAKAAP